MAGPPVRKRGLKRFPMVTSWPMGFKGSATVPQRLTELIAHRAGLPAQRRVVPGQRCPTTLPVWGAVMDDVWAVLSNERAEDMDAARGWLPAVEREWDAIGVPPIRRKGSMRPKVRRMAKVADIFWKRTT